jgi:hypothetical protein
MKLVSKQKSQTTKEVYEIEHEGLFYTLTEYLNEKGKVIDSILIDVDGEEIDNEKIIKEIQDFVTFLEIKN